MGLGYTLIPDYSMTLDRPYGGRYQKIPQGGTRPEDIAAMPGAPLTIQFGATCPDNLSPGLWLEQEYGVPLVTLPLPVGLEAADQLLEPPGKSQRAVPAEALATERGWLLDGMADAHKYNAEGRAVIYGEPELVYRLVPDLHRERHCPGCHRERDPEQPARVPARTAPLRSRRTARCPGGNGLCRNRSGSPQCRCQHRDRPFRREVPHRTARHPGSPGSAFPSTTGSGASGSCRLATRERSRSSTGSPTRCLRRNTVRTGSSGTKR